MTYFTKLGPGNYIDINPHHGHVHLADIGNENRPKSTMPVSFANDRTGERFRVDVNRTSIGAANAQFQRLVNW